MHLQRGYAAVQEPIREGEARHQVYRLLPRGQLDPRGPPGGARVATSGQTTGTITKPWYF